MRPILKNINIKGTRVDVYNYVNGSYVVTYYKDNGELISDLYQNNKEIASAGDDPKLIIYRYNSSVAKTVQAFAKDNCSIYTNLSAYFESRLVHQGYDASILECL